MKKYTVDMTKGNILKLIIAFAIPIIISGALQQLYNAADMIVVGKFAGKESLAAVGSTSSAITLMLNIFIGLSSATNVVVARKFGAGNKTGVSKAVHTAIAVSLIGGFICALAGICFSRKILLWMGSPDDVIELSVLYMKIYFAGVPAVMLYNFGSAIMRAVGDSKRPTYFLVGSGIINVVLNLVFVIVFEMDVAGVALATMISQTVSAVLVLRCLIKSDDCFKLCLKEIKIYAAELKDLVSLGIPAGIQSSVFSISNIIIQSSINSCGSDAMAANSASVSIEGLVYISLNALFHATLTFVGQNYGAHKFRRMRRGFFCAMGFSAIFGIILSAVVVFFGKTLLGFYLDSEEVIEIALERLRIVCGAQFLCGVMEVGTGGLRGMGVAMRSMITCLLGACGMRLVITILGAPYKVASDLVILYKSYPVSWIVTALALTILFVSISKNREKEWLMSSRK